MLLDRDRIVGAALDGRVVGDDHALAVGHPADSGNDSGARGLVVVHVVCGQRSKLQKRAARVKQAIHAFARQQLATTDMALPGASIPARARRRQLVVELRDQPAMLVCGRRRLCWARPCRHRAAAALSRITRGGWVFATTSSTVTSGAVSIRCSPSAQTSMTASSVTMRLTQAMPVSGNVQRSRILGLPSLAACSIITITLRAPCTRSIAPPMPLTILPGIIQLARSPSSETCMAPSTATSRCSPRMIPKEVDDPKYAAPGNAVTVSLPALIRSASRSSRLGYGPTPRMPFSECRTTVTPSGMWFGIRVGIPMPRLTYWPSSNSAATRAAIPSLVQLICRHSSSSLRSASSPVRSRLHRLLLDPFGGIGHVYHSLHENARGVHGGGVNLSGFDEEFHLGDGDPSGGCALRVEVAGGLAVHQVAVPVTFPCVHQREVGADAALEDIGDTVELAGLLGGRHDGHRT